MIQIKKKHPFNFCPRINLMCAQFTKQSTVNSGASIHGKIEWLIHVRQDGHFPNARTILASLCNLFNPTKTVKSLALPVTYI